MMPYPRITKVIIHYFLSKHNSIPKRHNSYINTIKDDGVLGKLKFLSKGEDTQNYGMSIPDVMMNDDIKNSKAYLTYLALSTSTDVPKKARKGKKATATLTKNGSITAEDNILKYPYEALKLGVFMSRTKVEIAEKEQRLHETHASIVIGMEHVLDLDKEAIEHQKKRKMKGVATVPDAAQEPLNLKKGTQASREADDERTKSDKEKAKSKKADDEEKHNDDDIVDEEETDDERTESEKDDQEIADAEKIDTDQTVDDKVDEEQSRDD
ncbi:hypothetical protein Tco_1439344 [Tanacetum coccineum]